MGCDVREQRHRVGGEERREGKEAQGGDPRLIRPGSGISETAAAVSREVKGSGLSRSRGAEAAGWRADTTGGDEGDEATREEKRREEKRREEERRGEADRRKRRD